MLIGEWRYTYTIFYLSTRRKWVVTFMPRPLYPWEIVPGTHKIGWMGQKFNLNTVKKRKIHAPARNRTPTVQPVTRTYTVSAISTILTKFIKFFITAAESSNAAKRKLYFRFLGHHKELCQIQRYSGKQNRSQWPRSLRHEISSAARTLGSWVRIALKAWMLVCGSSVFVLSCVGRGLASGWFLVQGFLPTV
jgi:hypothetical protein